VIQPQSGPHLGPLDPTASIASQFEAAVDAIVNGDLGTLRSLLAQRPELVRERSLRDHGSTLLHYVSANGIEDYRQKTPKNIVAIADLLLGAGADVNAESAAYGGRSTPLNLTATSVHPEAAGVQLELLEHLLRAGAKIHDGDVRACLRNGRGQAAEFLASHGAPLDFEGAAGVGRLDLVASLLPRAKPREIADGLAWACEFGKPAVVAFLLDHGIDVRTPSEDGAPTGLHWASYGGHREIVDMLLQRGAPVAVVEKRFGGTPLDWALHRYSELTDPAARAPYVGIVRALLNAGATVDSDDPHVDAEMRAALGTNPP